MILRWMPVLLLAVGLMGSPVRAAEPTPLLSDETLDKSIGCVKPCAAEDRYLEVPWFTNLMKARVESQLQGKPIFMWIMNGHPLGCT